MQVSPRGAMTTTKNDDFRNVDFQKSTTKMSTSKMLTSKMSTSKISTSKCQLPNVDFQMSTSKCQLPNVNFQNVKKTENVDFLSHPFILLTPLSAHRRYYIVDSQVVLGYLHTWFIG
jgi:hypothetical protein